VREWQGKRYWLVGASEGLGAALAHVMSRAGAEVIVSARSQDKLDALVADLPGTASAQTVDVSDRASVEAAAAAIGDIDGVVFLAGVYWPMRVVGSVMPAFAAKDAGHIVITGSLSGFRGLPGATGYAASKAGTMVMAESLYADLRKTGIDVQLANPGFIRTRLTDKNTFSMPFIMEPEEAAQEMFELMNSDAFKKSFPRLFSWVFRLSQFMPDWMYYRLFA